MKREAEFAELKSEILKTLKRIRTGDASKGQMETETHALRTYAVVLKTELAREKFSFEMEKYQRETGQAALTDERPRRSNGTRRASA